jgi:hypothetical protein
MNMSGGFNPVSLVSQVALGVATGGTSLLMEAALSTVVSQIGQQVIGQLGQQLGLPQSVIGMAQGAFAGALGDEQGAAQDFEGVMQNVTSQFQSTPSDVGQFQQASDNFGSQLNQLAQAGMQATSDQSNDSAGFASGSGGAKGSIFMKIAIALGKLMDQKMTDMADTTDQIGQLGTVDNSNQSHLSELTGKLQGLTQEIGLLSNALTNTLKSLGDASATLARKG